MNDDTRTEWRHTKDDEVISWQAPEFIFQEKSTDWFWAVIIITIALVVGSIFIKNFLLSILVGIAGFSLLMHGAKRPGIITLSISTQGIRAGNKFYSFENLEYFWIDYNPPHTNKLTLESNKLLMTHITIHLGDMDPDVMREILLETLKEKKIEEPFSETISKLLKF